MYLIFEFCSLGTLTEHMNSVQGYNLKDVAYIIKQVLLALSAIHENGAIHRDVKADNVLVKMIDPDPALGPRIKLTDFGFATKLDHMIGAKASLGTRHYMSPEMIEHLEQHTSAVDIWSVGVLAFYLISGGKYPFPGLTKEVVSNKIKNYEPEMHEIYDRDQETKVAKDFIVKCLKKNPADRKSAKELLESDTWFTQVNIKLPKRESMQLIGNMSNNVDHRAKYFQYAITSFITNILIKSQDVR